VKVGNLQSLRTVADVRDAVRAYHLLVTVDPQPGAYYNIGGSFSCTVEQILKTLIEMSPKAKDIRIEIDSDRLRPIDADLQVPDTNKFQRHTGWTPKIPFDVTMRDLLDYWRRRVAREGDRLLTR
jgi:nucleoside-diphosphate-sugar epimerase